MQTSCVAWRCSATHSRTQHAFDSIHTTHLLFPGAYKSGVHVSSSSDTAVGVCVCAGGKISRPYSHASDIARVIACAGCLASLSDANVGVLGLTSCECSIGSLCWLILLTVYVKNCGSQLRSSYISFVSSQRVSDPINSRVFSLCFACL